jgi:hypothetical protein
MSPTSFTRPSQVDLNILAMKSAVNDQSMKRSSEQSRESKVKVTRKMVDSYDTQLMTQLMVSGNQIQMPS